MRIEVGDTSVLTSLRCPRKECFCNYQFNVKACSIQGIFKTADVLKNDPDSFMCPKGTVDLMSFVSLSHQTFSPSLESHPHPYHLAKEPFLC